MKPYGLPNARSLLHIRRGGAPNGYYELFISACRCCDGKYAKKKHKSMKAKQRRQNHVSVDDYV